MAITQKQRTTALTVVAGLLVLGFAGYTYLKPTLTPAPAPVAKRKKPEVSVSQKPTPTPKVTPEIDEPPPTDVAVAAPPPVSSTDIGAPRDPMGDQIPDLTSRLSAERTLSEPDPRQAGGFPAEIFVRLDLNGDLRLEPQEIPTNYREQMLAMDLNNDGRINFPEFNQAIDRLPEPPALRTTTTASALINPPEPGQEIPTYEPMPMPTRRPQDSPVWFTTLDRSKDGHIAVYEWPAGRLNEFRALDSNDDGFITLEEARKAEAIKEEAEAKRRSQEIPNLPSSNKPRDISIR